MSSFNTTLYLLRHGETYHNACTSPPNGKTPEDPSELGQEQALCLANEVIRRLGGVSPKLYCSNQQRAIDTLDPIRLY